MQSHADSGAPPGGQGARTDQATQTDQATRMDQATGAAACAYPEADEKSGKGGLQTGATMEKYPVPAKPAAGQEGRGQTGG